MMYPVPLDSTSHHPPTDLWTSIWVTAVLVVLFVGGGLLLRWSRWGWQAPKQSHPKGTTTMSDVSQIGACLSDLVAQVHALVTEDDRGVLLAQRLREIHASADVIMQYAKRIAQAREGKPVDKLT